MGLIDWLKRPPVLKQPARWSFVGCPVGLQPTSTCLSGAFQRPSFADGLGCRNLAVKPAQRDMFIEMRLVCQMSRSGR